MVRTALPALVLASSAIVLATSMVPAGRADVPATAAMAGSDQAARSSPPATTAASLPAGSGASGAVAAAGRARAEPAAPNRARWRWPVRPRPPVARPFRAPRSYYGAGHRGLDLAAAEGTPVLAVEGGVVTHAGLVAGRGTVSVEHADGLHSTYEPVQPVVRVGASVETGQVLGVLRVRGAPAHCGARACLHLGARRGASYVDPYPLLAGGRLALLPLGR